MDNHTREKYLKMALVVFGVAFLLIYPLGMIWPSGWVWHGGAGGYYLDDCGRLCGAGHLPDHRGQQSRGQSQPDLVYRWSSVVHAVIMAVQAFPTRMRVVTSLAMCPRWCWPRPFFGSFRRGERFVGATG